MTLVLNGTTGVSSVDGSASTPAVQGTDTNTGMFFPAADTVAIATGGTERVRTDSSGNVGIGTSSPNLSASNRALTVNAPNAGDYSAVELSSGGALRAYMNATNGAFYIVSQSTNPMVFYTNGSERARIDSSGNLLMNTTGEVQFFTSSYGIRASTGLEIKTGDFTRFLQGTTERARIDSSGNVGIGTSSPAAKLDVYTASGSVTTYVRSAGSTGSDTANSYTLAGSTSLQNICYGNGYAYTLASASVAYTVGNAANAPVIFTTNNTERARIDSSGNLLVGGTTTFAARTTLYGTTGVTAALTTYMNSSGVDYHHYFRNDVGYVGAIYTSGSSTVYATSSDHRLKHDVRPMQNALEKVAALKPVTYKWNVDGSDGEGFIAHELQEVCPQAVSGQKDAVDADGNPVYQGVDTSFLVATLTAAIQELNAKVESLTAEIATLKGAQA